jgi:hemoglobin
MVLRMNRRLPGVAALAAALILVHELACAQAPRTPAPEPPAPRAAPADDSVYRAFGGRAGIRAVMEDFVPRLEADPRIGRFFRREGREHLIAMLTEQLCQEAGGPCTYEGAPMDVAHESLAITRADFNALVEVLQISMQAKGIPFRAQLGLLARLAPMHRQIVTE